jgi:hypothetical protein
MNFPSREFDEVVSAVCHGVATENELQELAELWRSEVAAQDAYLLAVDLHARLACDNSLFLPKQTPTLFPAKKSPWVTKVKSLPFLLLGGPIRAADRWSTAAALLVSYAVFYGAFFSLLWSLRPQPVERNPRQAAELAKLTAESIAQGVATLVECNDCQWEDGEPPAAVGGRITSALPLRLRSGQAILRFDSGAEVGVMGPVEARATSSGNIRLTRGRLAAHVPARAFGFTVETASARLVDLGTDFNVEVDETGETKMVVSRGAVEVAAAPQDATRQKVAEAPARITAGQSITISPSGKGVTVDRKAQQPDWVKELKLSDETPTAVIAYQTVNWAAGNYGDNAGALGLDFDVLRPIRVDALGVFDDLGDGIAPDTTLTVQLWSRDDRGTPQVQTDDQSGKLLAEERFDAAAPGVLMAGHRFKSLATPLELPVGPYTILAQGFSPKNRNINFKFAGAPARKAIETWRGAIAHSGARWGTAQGEYPATANEVNYPYVAGSFKFRPIERP